MSSRPMLDDGDIHYRKEVSEHLSQDVRQGVSCSECDGTYQRWPREGPELSVLRMLGLFDRPADEKAVCSPVEVTCYTGPYRAC